MAREEEEGYYAFLDEHLPTKFTCTHSAHLPGENETEIGVAILCLQISFSQVHGVLDLFKCVQICKFTAVNLKP